MAVLLWDSSALVKRYVEAVGSAVVSLLFELTPSLPMFTTVPCYTETYAILIRKANEGRLTAVALRSCLGALKHDVLAAEDFELISVGDETFLESVVHIAAHNLNSADAAFLAACLPVAAEVARSGDRPLCVTSDQRLIRAAAAQGPTSLNPEAVLPSGLAAFLNPFL